MKRVTAHRHPKPARHTWLQARARPLAVVLVSLSASACAETTLSQAAAPAAGAYTTDPRAAEYQAKLAA